MVSFFDLASSAALGVFLGFVVVMLLNDPLLIRRTYHRIRRMFA